MKKTHVGLWAIVASLAAWTGVKAQADDLAGRVEAAVTARAGEFIALRRDLHRHPEVSGAEVRTAGIVAERLRAFGLDVRTGVGGHGVVGLLRGGRPGPLVAYRADMDAVSSHDPDPVPFASEVPGVRHQCGHDVHVAVGLAVAAALSSVRDSLPGSVLFVFQPDEEWAAGARAMLAAGVFAAGKPVAIYGVHASPYEVGQIATRPGVMMAARDRVRVSVSGEGDTAAALDQARGVVQGISTIGPAQALQPQPEGFALVQIDPVPPGATTIQGSISLAGREARDRARAALASGLSAIRVPGVTVTYDYTEKAVAGVTNDAELTAAATAALVRTFGEAAVPRIQNIIPAFSEDFGSFQDEVPGVFFFLGVSNSAKGVVGMPHSPGFAADEDAIAFGARAMATVLLDRLAQRSRPRLNQMSRASVLPRRTRVGGSQ